MAITDWPADQRPRERLIEHGAHSLSDAELLAVFLRMGVAGKSAVDLGRDMLTRFGSLNRMFGASLKDFSEINGLGPAKYAQLQAVLELARRSLKEELRESDNLGSIRAVKEYLRHTLGTRQHESFVALFLDVQNRLIASEELFRGTLTRTVVHAREVVKAALAHNASGIILAHNHPSGTCEPSHSDQNLTQMLKDALGLVDVKVLDHFVIAGQETFSFAENGLL
jgi:DNA repair protein RadC